MKSNLPCKLLPEGMCLEGKCVPEGHALPRDRSRMRRKVRMEVAPHASAALLLFQFLQNFACCVRARAAGEPRPGMRSVPTQIQILDRRAVPRPIQQRAHGKELVERKISVKNLPAGKLVFFFQITGR